MNVSDAVAARRSIRDFLTDPVDDELLRDLLERAARAPSHARRTQEEKAVKKEEKKDSKAKDSKDSSKKDDKGSSKDSSKDAKKDDKKSDKKVNSEKDAKAKVLTGAVEP